MHSFVNPDYGALPKISISRYFAMPRLLHGLREKKKKGDKKT
jgi:hypothetical protein